MKRTTAIQDKQAEFANDDVIIKAETLKIYIPKTNFKGGSIKFFDDSLLLKSNKNWKRKCSQWINGQMVCIL